MCFDMTQINNTHPIRKRVWCSETGALSRGMAMCYYRSYGTAANAEESRDNRVKLPDSTNHLDFAGVLDRDYPANANGQWVEIHEPGSVTYVLADAATTLGNYGGFRANDAGSLSTAGTPGKWSATYHNGQGSGTVQYLQTIGSAGLCLARLLPGPQVGGIEIFTGTGAAAVVSPFGQSILTNSADNTSTPWTLANGTVIGQRKKIICTSITTANKIDFGASTLASIAGAANRYASSATNNNYIVAEWTGTHWKVIMMSPSGITLS